MNVLWDLDSFQIHLFSHMPSVICDVSQLTRLCIINLSPGVRAHGSIQLYQNCTRTPLKFLLVLVTTSRNSNSHFLNYIVNLWYISSLDLEMQEIGIMFLLPRAVLKFPEEGAASILCHETVWKPGQVPLGKPQEGIFVENGNSKLVFSNLDFGPLPAIRICGNFTE